MRHVPIAEFKDKASEIIAAAEAGEDITLTRHGREVVRMTGIEQERMARRRAALESILARRQMLYQQGVRVSIEEIVDWKNEGRR